MKIIPLSEGAFTIDATKEFVPFDLEKDVLNERPTGSLLVEIQPFIVQTNTQTILLDTGLGFVYDDEMQLHTNMRKNGIDPSDVTLVLLSHLHKDHAGGIAKKSEMGDTLAFPAATYVVHEKELQFAIEKGKPSYDPSDFSILKEIKNIQLLTGDSGNISDNIFFEISGGHCPYHVVFTITDNGEKVFFGGDVAPQVQQMKRKVIAKYDYDGRKCMELREKWWSEGKADHRTFLFYHDIKQPVVKG